MTEPQPLVEAFEVHRPRLRAIALRMLGSATDADDALQEAWIRTARVGRDDATGPPGTPATSATGPVDSPLAWLTTVVSRVCLTMLRTRARSPAAPLPLDGSGDPTTSDPDDAVVAGDEVAPALGIVMAALTPEERLAFVLHDAFALPFTDIAQVLDKSPTATRQLASRARRRVRAVAPGDLAPADLAPADLAPATRVPIASDQSVVDAFLAASRGGDLAALVRLLHPGALLRADATAVSWGAEAEVRGAPVVAATFAGRAQAARPARVDNRAAAIWMQGGALRLVFRFTIDDGLVTALELVADPEVLAALVITPLRKAAAAR